MPSPASRRPAARWILIALGVAALAAVLIFGGPAATTLAKGLRGLAEGRNGAHSLLVYALAAGFTFLAVLTPLPAEAAALLNGTLFPPLTAFLLTWISAMAGAAASYECGLRLGHRPAERLFGATRLARVQGLVDRAGWPTLLALRLSPVMAFTAINWASGILALSRPVFYWTVAVGLVPGTWVFTMAPELLLDRSATTKLLVVAGVVMLVLFGVTWGRVKRSGGAKAEAAARER
jgi:uncharacterized membrane protein YdjX (TVP38/TMEM64 family)